METFEQKRKKTAKRLGLELEQIPRNIAVIMDGNGRWAERKSLPRVMGHRQGAKIIESIALFCVDLGIESLTLYSFSTENWKRPKSEIEALMHIHSEYLVDIRPVLMKNNVKLIHLGRKDGLPAPVLKDLTDTMEQTSANTGMILALALNYSGRTELVDATRKIAKAHEKGELSLEDIDEKCISQNLYASYLGEPDLLIRTANEMRISNFLLWQISYSEFYVTKTLWPDFTKRFKKTAFWIYLNETIADKQQAQKYKADFFKALVRIKMLRHRLFFGTLMTLLFTAAVIFDGWMDGSLSTLADDKPVQGTILCILVILLIIPSQFELSKLFSLFRLPPRFYSPYHPICSNS